MAKYPVEIGDNEGTVAAVNYLLSGPSGNGQNFSGYSAYTPVKLTGNQRPPFTNNDVVNPSNLYQVVSVNLTERLDDVTIKCTFVGGLSAPPFSLGNGLQASGITGFDSTINNYGQKIGVVECTTVYCIIRLFEPAGTTPGFFFGGTLTYTVFTGTGGDGLSNIISTDCNARVTVTSATDRVFVGAQLDVLVDVRIVSPEPFIGVTVSIQRLKASSPIAEISDYNFFNDGVVIEKTYLYETLTTSQVLPRIEAVFTNVIDNPLPGYYWYVLSIRFEKSFGTDAEINQATLEVRSLAAQVVKQ